MHKYLKHNFFVYISLIMVLLSGVTRGYAQTCTSKQFSVSFLEPGLGNGGFLFKTVTDTAYVFGNINNYKEAVFKADKKGSLIWKKRYDFAEVNLSAEQTAGKLDKDGNYFFPSNVSGTGRCVHYQKEATAFLTAHLPFP